jgi:hypothetical protein
LVPDGCALDVVPEVDGVAVLLVVLPLRAPGCVANEEPEVDEPESEEPDVPAVEEPFTVPEVVPEAVAVDPVLPALLPAVPEPVVDPAAWLSWMQSMCTGLAERSLAMPVDLSASLPAFGWLSSLHSGLDAVLPFAAELPLAADFFAVPWASAAWLVDDFALAEPVALLLLVVCAIAGAAPSSAAMARVLR